MSKHDALPLFSRSVGDSIGRGKDNVVVPFRGTDTVLKWNHDDKTKITEDEHFNRLLYKKRSMKCFIFS